MRAIASLHHFIRENNHSHEKKIRNRILDSYRIKGIFHLKTVRAVVTNGNVLLFKIYQLKTKLTTENSNITNYFQIC